MKQSWVQLRDFKKAKVLLILPCNAAACVGNYFKAEIYSKRKWNTWREADANLRELRVRGLVAFAAVDSSTLETQPGDSRGALVLETEMNRVKNAEGEDWGSPSWRWFRPSLTGQWTHLDELTKALVDGVRRVEGMGFTKVLVMVNPRAYFLALASVVNQCGLLDSWVLFRPPAHPRYLLSSVQKIIPFVESAVHGRRLLGGIYPIPDHYLKLQKENMKYLEPLPMPWQKFNRQMSTVQVNKRWSSLKNSV